MTTTLVVVNDQEENKKALVANFVQGLGPLAREIEEEVEVNHTGRVVNRAKRVLESTSKSYFIWQT